MGEKDNAMDRADACEEGSKAAKLRAEKAEEEVLELMNKARQLETELDVTAERLSLITLQLEEKEKSLMAAEAEEDEKRMAKLEDELKEARNQAEEADRKYEEVAKKLQQCEADLERAEERAETGETKIMELEEELRVVANNPKSLEVAEAKANQREQSYKEQIKTLTARLKQAEARAE